MRAGSTGTRMLTKRRIIKVKTYMLNARVSLQDVETYMRKRHDGLYVLFLPSRLGVHYLRDASLLV